MTHTVDEAVLSIFLFPEESQEVSSECTTMKLSLEGWAYGKNSLPHAILSLIPSPLPSYHEYNSLQEEIYVRQKTSLALGVTNSQVRNFGSITLRFLMQKVLAKVRVGEPRNVLWSLALKLDKIQFNNGSFGKSLLNQFRWAHYESLHETRVVQYNEIPFSLWYEPSLFAWKCRQNNVGRIFIHSEIWQKSSSSYRGCRICGTLGFKETSCNQCNEVVDESLLREVCLASGCHINQIIGGGFVCMSEKRFLPGQQVNEEQSLDFSI